MQLDVQALQPNTGDRQLVTGDRFWRCVALVTSGPAALSVTSPAYAHCHHIRAFHFYR
jgi:hypothetical protein